MSPVGEALLRRPFYGAYPAVETNSQTTDPGNSIDLAYDTSLISGGPPSGWGATCERYIIGSTNSACFRYRSYSAGNPVKAGIRLDFDFILADTELTGTDIHTIAICKAYYEIDGVTPGTLGSAARCFRIFIQNEGTFYRWIWTLGEDPDPENIQVPYPTSAPGIQIGQRYKLTAIYDISHGICRFLVDDTLVSHVGEEEYFAGTTRRMPRTIAHFINGQSGSSDGRNAEFLMHDINWSELEGQPNPEWYRPRIFSPGIAR